MRFNCFCGGGAAKEADGSIGISSAAPPPRAKSLLKKKSRRGQEVEDEPLPSPAEQLQEAAKSGDVEMTLALLKAGAGPAGPDSVLDEQQRTPLHLAAQQGQAEAVFVLVTAGANVNQRAANRATPLHLASWGGHEKAIKALLASGASVTLADAQGRTALHLAAAGGHVAALKAILATKEAILSTMDKNGLTALHLAARSGKVDAILALVAYGGDPDCCTARGQTPVHMAVESAIQDGHPEAIEVLLTAGARVNIPDEDGKTPLHLAAAAGNLPAIRALLVGDGLASTASLASVTLDGRSPLHLAAGTGEFEAVRTLIAAGANVAARDAAGATPLHSAAQGGHTRTLTALLEKGANVNAATSDGMTPLHIAVGRGDVESVELLLGKGAEVSPKLKSTGMDPLHIAAREGRAAALKILIEAGADPKRECKKDNRFTALHYAVESGTADVETIDTLIAAGADPNAAAADGTSPLMLAAAAGDDMAAWALIKAKAEVMAMDKQGYTALHYVAECWDPKRAEDYAETTRHLLVGLPLDVDPSTIKAKKGETPLAIATTRGNPTLQRMLLLPLAERQRGAVPLVPGQGGMPLSPQKPPTPQMERETSGWSKRLLKKAASMGPSSPPPAEHETEEASGPRSKRSLSLGRAHSTSSSKRSGWANSGSKNPKQTNCGVDCEPRHSMLAN